LLLHPGVTIRQMQRLTTAIVLCAGVLVTTWVSAPAAPTAPPILVSDAEMAVIEATAPAAEVLDQEVARLRAQLAVIPHQPEPRRDPFSFGRRVPAPVESVPAATEWPDIVEPAVPVAPELLWPTLAAVMADDTGATAVLAWGDAIEFVTPGDAFGEFRVTSVTARTVELHHAASKTTKTITLR
jgi:hypothetical protein